MQQNARLSPEDRRRQRLVEERELGHNHEKINPVGWGGISRTCLGWLLGSFLPSTKMSDWICDIFVHPKYSAVYETIITAWICSIEHDV